MTDRGVSETLGFVLVFAIITGTIAIVYATGITGLKDAQQDEKVENVGRAFDVLADNLEDIHRQGASSRATEMRLAGGTLHTGKAVSIRVRAERSTNSSINDTYAATLEPIVYEDADGTKFVYESGAVVREEDEGAAMLSPPEWIVGPNRTVVPLVNTYGSGSGIAGEGTALVVAKRATSTLSGPFNGGGGTVIVNVTVTSPRAGAWKSFFEDQGYVAVDPDPADGNVTYSFETEELFVARTGVEVTFNR